MSTEQQPLLYHASEQDVEANEQRLEPYHEEEKETWREYTAERLESQPVHWFFLILIVLDAVIVISDLSYTLLNDSCSAEPAEPNPILEAAEYASIVIASIFIFEIPVTLWAIGTKFYNPLHGVPHAGMHLFDALVIVGTFVLEVGLRGREREIAGLLVLLRLWRIVKLVGGVAVGAAEFGEEGAKKLAKAQAELKDKDDEVKELRSQLAELRTAFAASSAA